MLMAIYVPERVWFSNLKLCASKGMVFLVFNDRGGAGGKKMKQLDIDVSPPAWIKDLYQPDARSRVWYFGRQTPVCHI